MSDQVIRDTFNGAFTWQTLIMWSQAPGFPENWRDNKARGPGDWCGYSTHWGVNKMADIFVDIFKHSFLNEWDVSHNEHATSHCMEQRWICWLSIYVTDFQCIKTTQFVLLWTYPLSVKMWFYKYVSIYFLLGIYRLQYKLLFRLNLSQNSFFFIMKDHGNMTKL